MSRGLFDLFPQWFRWTCSFAILQSTISTTKMEQRPKFTKQVKWTIAVTAEPLFQSCHVCLLAGEVRRKLCCPTGGVEPPILDHEFSLPSNGC